MFTKLLQDNIDSNVVCMLAYWYSHQELCVRWNSSVSGFLRRVMELGKAAFYLRFYFVVTLAIYFMILHRLALVVILVEFLSIFFSICRWHCFTCTIL